MFYLGILVGLPLGAAIGFWLLFSWSVGKGLEDEEEIQ